METSTDLFELKTVSANDGTSVVVNDKIEILNFSVEPGDDKQQLSCPVFTPKGVSNFSKVLILLLNLKEQSNYSNYAYHLAQQTKFPVALFPVSKYTINQLVPFANQIEQSDIFGKKISVDLFALSPNEYVNSIMNLFYPKHTLPNSTLHILCNTNTSNSPTELSAIILKTLEASAKKALEAINSDI